MEYMGIGQARLTMPFVVYNYNLSLIFVVVFSAKPGPDLVVAVME